MKMKRALSILTPFSLAILALGVLPRAAHAGFSGDVVIDAAITPGYKIRAGGKGGSVSRNNNLLCNNPPNSDPIETKCPNDAQYTPAAATGGYQAWGVGLAKMYEEDEELQCDFDLVFTWIEGVLVIEEVWSCGLVTVLEPAGYWGMAAIRLRWGSQVDGTGQWSPFPTSVMAFHENSMAPCNPLVIPPTTVQCGNHQNSSWILDSGYEADIVMPDPACLLGFAGRDGDIDDYNAGCFFYDRFMQISTLPAFYGDTTKFDNGNTFNIGFGSAAAHDIDPGHTYVATQFFRSKSQPNMISPAIKAKHVGAITTEVPTLCLGGLAGAAFCFFGVDTASVGGSGKTFSQVIP